MKIKIKPEQEVIKKITIKTQKDWVKYFNNKKEKMISLPDIYKAVNNKPFIKNAREEFENHWLVTSTRIIYNKNNLKAKIIHDAGSKVVKPKEYKNILVPDYSGDFKEDKTTEKFLQALFDTKDKIKKILETLKKISGKEKIGLLTPSQSSREDQPIRFVGLYCNFLGRFVVSGGWFGVGCGCSHGVVIKSEPKARTKKRQSK